MIVSKGKHEITQIRQEIWQRTWITDKVVGTCWIFEGDYLLGGWSSNEKSWITSHLLFAFAGAPSAGYAQACSNKKKAKEPD